MDMVSSLSVQPSTTTDPAGERFLRYIATGDVAILDSLLSEHLDRVFSQAVRLLGNAAEAEDAVQEALFILIRTARKYDGTVPFAAWLSRRVHFSALTIARSRRRRHRREMPSGDSLDGNVAPGAHGGEQAKQDMIHSAVLELPATYRETIDLHYFSGLSQGDTAKALGIRENAVAKRLQRGREILRTLLQRRGVVVTSAAIALALGSVPAHAASAAMATKSALVTKIATRQVAASAGSSATLSTLSTLLTGKVGVAALVVAIAVSAMAGWWAVSALTANFSREWNFDDGHFPEEFVADGVNQWIQRSDSGIDNSGCLEMSGDAGTLRLDIPLPDSPLLVTWRYQAIDPGVDLHDVVKVTWAGFEHESFVNNPHIEVKQGTWTTWTLYLTNDRMDIWCDKKRCSLNWAIHPNRQIVISTRSRCKIDAFAIRSIRESELPRDANVIAAAVKDVMDKDPHFTGTFEVSNAERWDPNVPITVTIPAQHPSR
jgi:RNA polymerase sigma-70 factor, ECF subfamily